jgi:hypothetical protein
MVQPLAAVPDIGSLSGTIIGFIVLFIIYLLIMGFVLYIAGRLVVGRRVTFGEALGVAGSATFLVAIVVYFLLQIGTGIVAFLVGALVFLFLVKHYFRTGWLRAIGVAITAVVVLIILAFVLGIAAFGSIFLLPRYF